jgi:hypothetical protein
MPNTKGMRKRGENETDDEWGKRIEREARRKRDRDKFNNPWAGRRWFDRWWRQFKRMLRKYTGKRLKDLKVRKPRWETTRQERGEWKQ